MQINERKFVLELLSNKSKGSLFVLEKLTEQGTQYSVADTDDFLSRSDVSNRTDPDPTPCTNLSHGDILDQKWPMKLIDVLEKLAWNLYVQYCNV
jgi:hypothetical protein